MKESSGQELNRRLFMKRSIGAAVGSALMTTGVYASNLPAAISPSLLLGQKSAQEWKNWSGSVVCNPKVNERPASEEEVVDLVRKADSEGMTIKLAGSGHSFTPLCKTDDMILSLADLTGVVDIDSNKLEATVLGGTKLRHTHKPLREAGMAMENISDIDRQAIAGAIATGTHGTGHGIRSISNQVVGLRMVTADGEILECSPDAEPEAFKAGQVSLGALGVITQVRMKFMPTYRLYEKVWRASFDEIFADLDKHITDNRHFEFFWVSQVDGCMAKTLNITDKMPDEMEGIDGERIDHSDIIFPSIRSQRFNEIEYSVPEEQGPDCLLELRQLMLTKHTDISMPLEYRTVGKDDIYLSPAYGRDTVTISAHQGARRPYKAFFGDVEAVFRNHNGRPHWGKIHTMKAPELEALYPEWESFQKVRKRLDPDGRFMNDHLREILG